ncbi:MAG TPA: type II secretion system protein GspM [Polyangia bacterium]|nr:type II secretion system protein GspM [Polyangia bacterium]
MSALGNLRESAARLLHRPIGYFRSEWERLSPRSKRLVSVGAAVVAIIAVLMGVWGKLDSIDDLEDQNAAIRDALTAISKHRDEYLEAKARNSVQEARIGDAPPQLAGDLEAAAHAENIQIAESSERPTVPAGRRYIEHDTDLKIRETDLQSLTNFLRRVETGPRLIFFTRLALKHPYGADAGKLDVEATATAFEKVHEDKTKKKAAGQDKQDKQDK